MMADHRPLKPIPISAGKMIADAYGYDQVVIIGRRVGEAPEPYGEHVTTFGRAPEHSAVAARIGDHLKHRVMRWPGEISEADLGRLDSVILRHFPGAWSGLTDDQVCEAARAFANELGIVTLPDRRAK